MKEIKSSILTVFDKEGNPIPIPVAQFRKRFEPIAKITVTKPKCLEVSITKTDSGEPITLFKNFVCLFEMPIVESTMTEPNEKMGIGLTVVDSLPDASTQAWYGSIDLYENGLKDTTYTSIYIPETGLQGLYFGGSSLVWENQVIQGGSPTFMSEYDVFNGKASEMTFVVSSSEGRYSYIPISTNIRIYGVRR